MPKLSVYNISGQATGEEIELNDLVFGVEFNEAVVHQAIVMQQAAERQNVVTMLSAFDAADKKALLITDGSNENVELSSRNIPKVTALSNGCLNCFDLLHNNKVFLAKDAVAKIEEVLA